MSDNTHRHNLPYIMAAQAQKHVTHNEALRLLDGLCNLYLIESDTTTPPAQPANGDSYTIGPNAIDAWENHDGEIALFSDGAWLFAQPFEGLRAFRMNDSVLLVYQSGQWNPVVSETDTLAMLGINTQADTANKLSVKSDSILFTTDDQAQNTTGNMRLYLNRETSLDNCSIHFQTGYSSNAEIGYSGNNQFNVKVSSDGVQFQEALSIDETTAHVGIGCAPGAALDVQEDSDGELARLRLTNSQTTPGSGAAFTLRAGNGQITQFLQYASAASYLVTSSTSLFVQATGQNPLIRFFAGAIEGIRVATTHVRLSTPIRLASYSVSQLPSASISGAGSQIYVNDEAGGSVVAFSDGSDWRRMNDRAVVS